MLRMKVLSRMPVSLLTCALEYVALITGYQFLLTLVGVLYGLAFITGRRRLAGQQPARS